MSILKAGFVASIPAVCGFVGGVLGGVISDLVNAPHRLAEHCAQNADCAGDAALHDHADV